MVPITLSQIEFAFGDRGGDFSMLRPGNSGRARHSAQRAVGFPCQATLSCTKRITSKVPLKPNFQPQNANSRYVLRPSPDNIYSGSRCSSCSFGRNAQGGVDPRPPAGLPAAARTALLVPAEGSPASHPPRWGSPRARPSHHITSTNSLPITPRLESA